MRKDPVPLFNVLCWLACLVTVAAGDAGLLNRVLAGVPILFGLGCGFVLLARRGGS